MSGDEDRRAGADEVLARVVPSPARRIFGLTVLVLLGGLVLWLGLAAPEATNAGAGPAFRLLLTAMGGLVLWSAWAMHRATEGGLVLTATDLRTVSGRLVARVADIERVDRGLFAFKPSNGFVLRLSTPGPRAWAPGLWWRLGRRVGVGGVARAAETRAMADAIAVLLIERAVAAASDRQG